MFAITFSFQIFHPPHPPSPSDHTNHHTSPSFPLLPQPHRPPQTTTTPCTVEGCMQALRSVLGREGVMVLSSKWYLLRNTPGCAGHMGECSLLQSCVLSLIGYHNMHPLIQHVSSSLLISPYLILNCIQVSYPS